MEQSEKRSKRGKKTEELYRVFFISFLFLGEYTDFFLETIVNEREWDHKIEAYKESSAVYLKTTFTTFSVPFRQFQANLTGIKYP